MSIPFITEPVALGNTFHCTHRHKNAANITTKHPHTPNSSRTATAINGTEPSWELQILLQPKPVDKCYTTASVSVFLSAYSLEDSNLMQSSQLIHYLFLMYVLSNSTSVSLFQI